MNRRLVIVGGGISGLAAAWEASATPGLEVVVLDDGGAASTGDASAGRAGPGGKLRTSALAGIATDEAADMFLARVPEGIALAEELGLADRITSPVVGSAAIWLNGSAHPMPDGLVLGVPTDPDALAGSPLLEPADVAAVRAELSRRGPPVEADRSIGSLVRERLGDNIAARLVQPLLGGINAGEVDRLSLAAVAPQIDAAARSGPSLTAALAATRAAATKAQAAARVATDAPVEATGASAPNRQPTPGAAAPVFYGLPGGMAELIDTLRSQLAERGVLLRDGIRAEAIRRVDSGARVAVEFGARPSREELVADAVILAVPAAVAAAILRGPRDLRVLDGSPDAGDRGGANVGDPAGSSGSGGTTGLSSATSSVAPETVAALGQLRTASVAMLRLAVRPERVTTPPGRSGLLVPHGTGFTTVAVSYASTKWAHLAGDGLVRLRISVGHDGDPASPRLPEAELIDRVLAEAATLTGLEGPLEDHSLIRWLDAFPQYDVGHLERCDQLDATLAAELPQVKLTGASYRGIGIPACIRQGREAAAAAISG